MYVAMPLALRCTAMYLYEHHFRHRPTTPRRVVFVWAMTT